jgi:sulfotransferase family protein
LAATETLRIDDLRHPVLNLAQREALAAAQSASFDLSVDGVLSAAARRTGLDDFGPSEFLERLALLIEVTRWPGHTALARLSTYNRMVNKASDRLLTVDLLRRHPEIAQEPIEAPLVVTGLPRSGTTHLLNLIAADSRFASMPYWQVLRPVPLLPQDAIGADGVDPRWQRAQRAWESMQQMNPFAAAHHPMNPDHISEDGELQMADFSSYVWEFSLQAPQWRDYYLEHDQTPHYEYQKLMMQVLQWQRGERTRWIVKAPQHFEQLPAIMNVFPDALVVFTHRDPVASLQSIVTMGAYSARWRLERLDIDAQFEYWADRYARLLDAYLRDVDTVPKAQRFDVLFSDFVGDDIATVARIYAQAGLDMDQRAARDLNEYMSGHFQGSQGRVAHDLRGDFGVEPAEVRQRYSAYLDRVAVTVEAR